MAFPQTVLSLKGEIYVGSWVDITSYTQNRDGVEIKRGRADQQNQVSPSTCEFSLNNRDGRFSPRNPTSPYFGLLGRNTPVRWSLPGTAGLLINQNTGATVGTANVSTFDAASLDITGDIDLRFQADLDSWTETIELIGKWNTVSNQRSYLLSILVGGFLRFRWSSDGTNFTIMTSTVALPVTNGPLTVRATFDANNGAAGNTTTFYYGTAGINGAFTQLGDPVVTAGVASMFSGTATLVILDNPNSNVATQSVRGKVQAAQVRSGIAGTVVANPDFTIQTPGVTSFADSTPKTWTLNGTVAIDDRDYRIHGEMSALPVKWDTSGTDVWTPAEAAGVLRRLGQGAAALPSAWRRVLRTQSDIVAYWPTEEEDGATQFASDISGGRAMTWTGTPNLSTYTGKFFSSAPIPTLGLSKWVGIVPAYTITNAVQLTMFIGFPSGDSPDQSVLARLNTTGSITRVDVVYGITAGGTLAVRCYNSTDALIIDTGNVAINPEGNDSLMSVTIVQNGANVDVQISLYGIFTAGSGSSVVSSAAATIKACSKVLINPNGTLDNVAVGHVMISNSSTAYTNRSTLRDDMNAFIGETAGARFTRLCTENGIDYRIIGHPTDTVRMGYQLPDTLLNLLSECEASDGGILYEPRDFLGLAYVPRQELYNQTASASADYSLSQMAALEPVDDDSATRNDITVTRKGGSSSRVVMTTGPLSTNSPVDFPRGVGVYNDSISLSLELDTDTIDQAGWRLALGTVDEARYPEIPFDLTSPSIVASSTLVTALGSIEIGRYLQILNPPAWVAPGTISQIVQGYTEFLNNFERRITFNCSPSAVLDQAGVYGSATHVSRYSSDGSQLQLDITSTATSMSVATPSGPLWITTALVPGDFPFDIILAGEQIRVGAISGTSSPQTFSSLTRSVNGVVKAQFSGDAIELFDPAYYAL